MQPATGPFPPTYGAWPRGQLLFGAGPPWPEWSEAVACIGTFDGVHLGHQAVIGSAIAEARNRGRPAGVITFDRHPAEVLAPDRAPAALSSLGEKLRLLLDLGPEFVLVVPFDERLRETTASEFLESVVVRKARATNLVIGHDFGFGKDREGDSTWLASRFETVVVPPQEIDGRRVSSSAVRAAIQDGRVEEATALLGRPFALEGIVVSGDRLGRELGFPTANLARLEGLVAPAEGVYVGRASTPFGEFAVAVSVGRRETVVAGGSVTIEAFLLDYNGESLYGRPIRVQLLHYLRGQERFANLDALKEQMARDVAQVRQWVM
jgi:riboflavin kinase/FMN adenylyltransferase